MPKDYTDYVPMVLDAGEKVYHLGHIRSFKGKNFKKEFIQGKEYPFHGHRYLLNLDRAYRFRWAPWKKYSFASVKGFFWSFRELTRSKKVGVIFYQEPQPPTRVEMITGWECECGFRGKTSGGTKTHASSKGHKAHPLITVELINVAKEPIEPMHISTIHQPGGEARGQTSDKKSIENILTPFGLKMIVESSNKYRKAFKSYAFGLAHVVQSKWVYLLVLGVMGVVLLMYFTGYIQV
jgi:hypothetical protein